MAESIVSLDEMNPKQLMKEFKDVAKTIKSKDDAVRQSTLDKFAIEPRYLTEGGCLIPLLEAIAPKKKSLDFSNTALQSLLQFVDAKPVVDSCAPGLLGLNAIQDSEQSLDVMQILADLMLYKDEVKKPKEVKVKAKKGEPIPEPVPVPLIADSDLSVAMRAGSLKAIYMFTDLLTTLPAHMSEEKVTLLKISFARIPNLVNSLCSIVMGFPGFPGGTDTPPLCSRMTGEDAILAEAAVQEGVYALATLVLVVRYDIKNAFGVLASSGVNTQLPTLAANEALSLYCVQLLDILSLDSTSRELVAEPSNLAVLLGVAERSATSGGSRTTVAEMATVVNIVTSLAQLEGRVLEEEFVTRLTVALSTVMINPAVWETCRGPDSHPFDTPLHAFLDNACIMVGLLGKVSNVVRKAVYQAGAVAAAMTVLFQSADVVGNPVAPLTATGPAALNVDEGRTRISKLRRVAEQAILFILTEEQSEGNLNLGRRWDACSRRSTDETLFSQENVAFPKGTLLEIIAADQDDDLNNRGIRILSALLQSVADPLSFVALLGLDASDVARVAAVSQARGVGLMEKISQESATSSKAGALNNSVGILTVRGLACASLTDTDITSDPRDKSDPYVKLILGSSSTSTECISNNLNPKFDGEFSLPWDGSSSLRCEVFDKDLQKEDESLGSADIPLSDFHFSNGGVFTVTNMALEGAHHGTISLELSFEPHGVQQKVVDCLCCESGEALYHSLCVLEPLLQVSAEFLNAFATSERISTLAQLLLKCGMTVATAPSESPAELAVALFDPRLLSWIPDAASLDADKSLSSIVELRPMIFDILTTVAAADTKYRTYEVAVPSGPSAELPTSTSPCTEQSLAVCKLCSDVMIATLTCFQKFALTEGDVLISIPAPESAENPSVASLEAALRLLQAMASCGPIGCLTSLQAVADMGFSAGSSSSAMLSLKAWLNKCPVCVPVSNGEDAEGIEPQVIPLPGTVPEGFSYSAPSTFVDTADYFQSGTVPTCARLLLTPSLWPLVTLCAPLVAILGNPQHTSATASYAAKALSALTKIPLLLDTAQPVVADALSSVFLSLGGGVALLGACGVCGHLPTAEKEVYQTLASYLICRGSCREEYWREVHAAAGDAEADEAPVMGSDPNGGPDVAHWKMLLNIISNDLHGKTSSSTPLITAIQSLLPAAALLLVRYGADIDRCDGFVMAPLSYAMVLGMADVVSALIDKECNLNYVDARGNPPILYALLSLSPECIAATLTGTSPEEEQSNPIKLLGQSSLASLLIEAMTDLRVSDVDGNSPLLMAMGLAKREIRICGYVLEITSNAYSSPAAAKDTLTVVSLLLRCGALVNFCNQRCLSPLHIAAARGHMEMIDLLLKHSAAPNAMDCYGYLPLHYAVAACPEFAVEVVDRLMARGEAQPLLRLAFEDQRTGKCEEEKIMVDIDSAFRDIFTAAIDPLSIRTARHSAQSILLLCADNGMNILQLGMSAHQLQDDALSPYLVGNKEERMKLGVHIASVVRDLKQLVSNVDMYGSTVVHSASLLLQGHTEKRTLTAAELRSKRVKYYPSLELNLLDRIFSCAGIGSLATARSSALVSAVPCLPSGWTPLHAAIAGDNADLVKMLLANGSDVCQAGCNYVHFLASSNAGWEVSEAIVAAAAGSGMHNALLNSVAPTGNAECDILACPLHIAARRGNSIGVQTLVTCKQCDPNQRDPDTGTTAVHDCIERSDLATLESFAAAADRIDLLVENREGLTCVDIAIQAKENALVAKLLEMRRNDVIERILYEREGKESLLMAIERANMLLARECGFSDVYDADNEAHAEEKSSEKSHAAVSAQVQGETVEEAKGEEQSDAELVVMPSASAIDSPKIISPHDLKLLQESDSLVAILVRSVSGLDPAIHIHPYYHYGPLRP